MMLTSAGLRGDAARCRELGVAAYLTKPISESDLIEAIRRILAPRPGAEASVASGGAAFIHGSSLVTRHSIRESTRHLRILLAEDNEINRRVVVRWLEKRGHAVDSVVNGEEAVCSARTGAYDLALMDVQMPVMGGLDATAAIRAHERDTGTHLPIVALTARAMKGDAEVCLAAGMDAYLAKPLNATELFDTLERLVPRRDLDRPASDDPKSTPSVLDLGELIQRCDGDEAFAREVIGMFRSRQEELLRSVSLAVSQGSPEALEGAAHCLKGALRTLAAHGAAAAAARLEEFGRREDLEIGDALGALEREMARLDAALAGMEEGKAAA
jgi:CheY-like chemotaxis protein/HPt (histidine-containing phosphotransfer) domain-containing protein